MSKLELRTLTPDDADQYWTLRLESLEREPWAFAASPQEYDGLTPELLARRHLADKGDGSFMLGAFDGGKLVGMAGCIREGHLKRRHRASVVAVYLTASHRGHGYGRRLIEEIVRRAREIEGLEILTLGVISDDTPAHRLYHSLGFQPYGIERRGMLVEGVPIDEELMELKL